MIDDRVGSEQVAPRFIQKRRDPSRLVSEQLRHGEVNDAARLRKPVTDFFQQVHGYRVQRIQRAKSSIMVRTGGINLFQFLRQAFDSFRIRRLLPKNSPGDQITDVRGRQQKTDRIPILNFPKQIVLDFSGVLDLLLQGGQYPQRVFLSPFSKELQETKVLVEALSRRLRAQVLR